MNLDEIHKIVQKGSEDMDGREVKGYDFNGPFDFSKFLDSYFTTGFQATHLRQAIEIIKKMREEKVTVFLAYTSNMVSSGLREIIAYLVKNKFVDVLVTTAGGVEEDVVKTLKPFVLGDWNADGAALREKGINRIGNILVPDNRYVEFEKLLIPFMEKLMKVQKETGKIFSASEFCHELGKEVVDESSILFWATKNDIPVFCPALMDGSMGDMMYFFKHRQPEFKIDIADDVVKINNIAVKARKTGLIILGGSLPKHYTLNANLFRGGADYEVCICTGTEYDGSVGGAKPEESKAWGKIKADVNAVQIEGDATIIFPLVVAGAFKQT